MVETVGLSQESVKVLPIEAIRPSPFQPRKHFGEAALNGLADSIREHGILQPLVVRPFGTSGYEIVMGERRLRAARIVRLAEVPALVREYSDQAAAEGTIVENLQREDLVPTEQARGIETLLAQGLSPPAIARRLGKSIEWLQDRLMVVKAPMQVQQLLDAGKIHFGHLGVIMDLRSDKERVRACALAEKLRLTVPQLIARTQHLRRRKIRHPAPTSARKLARLLAVLSEALQNFDPHEEQKLGPRLVLVRQMRMLANSLEQVRNQLEQEESP